MKFKLESKYSTAGDKPKAIKQLRESIKDNQHIVLLGAAGACEALAN